MLNTEKYDLLNKITKDIYDKIKREHIFTNEHEITHILFNAFDKYLIIDEQNLRDKLKVNILNNHDKEEVETYKTSLNILINVDKKALEKDKKAVEKYINDYIKDQFCFSLDVKTNTDEVCVKGVNDYIEFRNILEKRGISTLKDLKEFFNNYDISRESEMNRSLNEYYSNKNRII